MLHKLQHPQIPRFWEFFGDDKRLFLVQDYIEGKTYQSLLEERIAAGQTFSEGEIIELLRQLLPVLSYLHSLGIIHRDISPDNLICRASDKLPVLIDLGGVTWGMTWPIMAVILGVKGNEWAWKSRLWNSLTSSPLSYGR